MDNRDDICDKEQIEEIVCKFIHNNKRLSKEQTNNIYALLKDDIINNNIPDTEYWRTDKESTFNFSIRLTQVSVDTLIKILLVAGYKK